MCTYLEVRSIEGSGTYFWVNTHRIVLSIFSKSAILEKKFNSTDSLICNCIGNGFPFRILKSAVFYILFDYTAQMFGIETHFETHKELFFLPCQVSLLLKFLKQDATFESQEGKGSNNLRKIISPPPWKSRSNPLFLDIPTTYIDLRQVTFGGPRIENGLLDPQLCTECTFIPLSTLAKHILLMFWQCFKILHHLFDRRCQWTK